ncbi:S24 family peptidase [Pseudomonas sp. NR3]|jgi:phage repressor protein C with HTH and peptisase S24 domain|uniref:LexA family transcriptional regulator n=1 Tax=Pseudomonas sp. NR3 TaxID=3155978 RepID=UPI003B679087
MTKDSRRLPLAEWQLEDSDRLKEIFQRKRSSLKLTQEKIAAELGDGVTQGAVSHFMNRRTALSLKAAVVFARMLQVPVSEFSPELAKQLESMTSDPTTVNNSRLSTDTPPNVKSPASSNSPLPAEGDIGNDHYAFIPQYDAKAAAGLGSENPHVEIRSTLAFKRKWLKAKRLKPEQLIVIYADGQSMWPTINHRDVLLVDLSIVEPIHGQVFVLAHGEKAIVKRLVKSPGGDWIIRSDNQNKVDHPDRVFTGSDAYEHRIIGKVIWRGGDL